MTTINIVRQILPPCMGPHADADLIFTCYGWEYSDPSGSGEKIETLHRDLGESDAAFSWRARERATEVDRELACSRCYVAGNR